ncbi:unnamed protein product, partial [Vitis vinifera]
MSLSSNNLCFILLELYTYNIPRKALSLVFSEGIRGDHAKNAKARERDILERETAATDDGKLRRPPRDLCRRLPHRRLRNEFGLTSEFAMDSEINRRILATSKYISYGALQRNSVPCSRRGASYYNCQPGAQANPYNRGCSTITRCRS